MAKQPKAWVFDSTNRPKAPLYGTLKSELETKARKLIEGIVKPTHIKPPPEDIQFNYLTDITVKWIGSTFYFISIYASPGPNSISPTFEEKFARLQYVGDAKFTISYMRHNGKWGELFTDVSVDECMKAIKDDPWFQP